MTKNNKRGFTIIEVVLVLAIAGLIFLMVFIALPALQRSQRNTRRRQDMARILSAVVDYQSANGKIPFGATYDTNFVSRYIDETCTLTSSDSNKYSYSCSGDQFKDPDGSEYVVFNNNWVKASYPNSQTVVNQNYEDYSKHIIYAVANSKCDSGEYNIGVGYGDNDISIKYVLEGGAIYCGDNQ